MRSNPSRVALLEHREQKTTMVKTRWKWNQGILPHTNKRLNQATNVSFGIFLFWEQQNFIPFSKTFNNDCFKVYIYTKKLFKTSYCIKIYSNDYTWLFTVGSIFTNIHSKRPVHTSGNFQEFVKLVKVIKHLCICF